MHGVERGAAARNERDGWRRPLAVATAAALGAAVLHTLRNAHEAERRLPPVGRSLTIDGVQVHYVDRGRGPAVVFLHGVQGMIEEVEASGVIERLARTNRVLVFDRPGYGYSTRPRTQVWTPAAQAAVIRAAMVTLGLDRVVVVGHSWGTLVALALALEHPNAVGGLVLIGGYYYPTPRADVLPFALGAVPLLGDLLRHTVTPALGRLAARRAVARMFAPRPIPARFVSEYPLALALRPEQLRAAEHDAAMLIPAATLLSRRYREIRHPLLLLAGLDDRMVDPRQSQRLREAVPHSVLRLYPGVGHMLHHAMPDAVARAAAAMSGTWPAPRRSQDWYSGYEPGPDGRVSNDTLVDDTMADSFPASDPPGYANCATIGAPAR